MPVRVTSVRIEGVQELLEKFRTLPEDMRRKVVVPAAKEAMEFVKAAAEENAHIIDRVETRNYLPANIAMVERRSLGKKSGSVIIQVGMRRARRGENGGNTFYWWWVELGTRYKRPRSFLRLAMDSNKEKVLFTFISAVRYNLYKLGE